MSIAAKDTHLPAINHHLRAVAIVFDFVNPVLPLWRLLTEEASCGSMNLSRAVTRNMGLLRLVDNRQRRSPGRWIARGFFPLLQEERR